MLFVEYYGERMQRGVVCYAFLLRTHNIPIIEEDSSSGVFDRVVITAVSTAEMVATMQIVAKHGIRSPARSANGIKNAATPITLPKREWTTKNRPNLASAINPEQRIATPAGIYHHSAHEGTRCRLKRIFASAT